MSEQPKGFTVNDRRHFSPDGSPRDGAADEPVRPPAMPAEVQPDPHPAGPDDPVDFGGFLLSLAAQASHLMGLAVEDGAEPPELDLHGARQIISILEMLEEKTEGRRTTDEERLLQGILYQLRMAWVSRSQGGVA
jgi:Domain of unknown function (DUF1844)